MTTYSFDLGRILGEKGDPGPNAISTTTTTDLAGLLKGNGATVEAAVAGVDFTEPPQVRETDIPPDIYTEGTPGQLLICNPKKGADPDIYILESIETITFIEAGQRVTRTLYNWDRVKSRVKFTGDSAPPTELTTGAAGQFLITDLAMYICTGTLTEVTHGPQYLWKLVTLLNLTFSAAPTQETEGLPGQQGSYDGKTYICLGGNSETDYEWVQTTSDGFVSVVTNNTVTNLDGLLVAKNNLVTTATEGEDFESPGAVKAHNEDEQAHSSLFEKMGLPPGGSEGQVLKKASNKDYDTAWGDTVMITVESGGLIIE